MSNQHVQGQSLDSYSGQILLKGRDIAIDYLRGIVIFLVVFHHAALAYTSFSTFNETRYVASTAPIVDASRWPFLDAFVTFNDTFFMALLFFVSGIFTFSSLERKGSGGFFIARLQRLGIPFVVASISIIPLAYWPSRMLSVPEPQSSFWITFFTSDGWPSGPGWFLWVLLAFSSIVALVYRIAPSILVRLRKQPNVFVIFLVTIIAYLPVSLYIHPFSWMSLGGPLDVQTSRVVLYFAYFLLGAVVGACKQWRRIGWPKLWGAWLILGFISFFVYIRLLASDAIQLNNSVSRVILSVPFTVSCASLSLGFLGAFRKFVRKQHPIFDSLSANAYGIYIIHYVFITWIQFFLLSSFWPAWIKFFITLIGGFALSWGTSILTRKIQIVRRVL